MKSVFADTSFYLATLNPKDDLHDRAVEVSRRIRGKVVTTRYVLTEVGNAMCRRVHRRLFLSLIRQLRTNPRTVVLPASDELFEEGLDLYASRPDKEWSLTDCISFVVMTEEGIRDALTGDHHFEQAGFHALLR